MEPRTVARGLAVVRLGVGCALLLAPRVGQRVWLGPGRRAPRLGLALGARDLLVGALTLRSVAQGEGVGRWLRAGAVADVADAAGHLLAGPRLSRGRRLLWGGSAAGAAAVGWWAGARTA